MEGSPTDTPAEQQTVHDSGTSAVAISSTRIGAPALLRSQPRACTRHNRAPNWRIHDDYDGIHRCVCSPKDAQAQEATPETDPPVISRTRVETAARGQHITEHSAELLAKRRFNRKQNIMTTTDTAEAGPSVGQVRFRETLEATAIFSKLDREKERNLYGRKWFDYRFLSPIAATAHFYVLYQDVYRWKYAASIDTLEAEKKTGVSIKATRGERTSFWRARQFADELGVTYEIFLEATFQLFIRNGWSRLPHVNQLYGDKNREVIASAVKSRWAEQISSRFTISILPQYHEESYRRLEAQIDHRKWVMDQIKARHGAPLSIGRACYIHRVLPERDAFLEYGQERLDQAKAEITFSGLIPDESSLAITMPSCFGLPGAHDAGGGKCDACQAFRPCLRIEAAARNQIIQKYGSDDPVLNRRKAQGRGRTARFRERNARRSEA